MGQEQRGAELGHCCPSQRSSCSPNYSQAGCLALGQNRTVNISLIPAATTHRFSARKVWTSPFSVWLTLSVGSQLGTIIVFSFSFFHSFQGFSTQGEFLYPGCFYIPSPSDYHLNAVNLTQLQFHSLHWGTWMNQEVVGPCPYLSPSNSQRVNITANNGEED